MPNFIDQIAGAVRNELSNARYTARNRHFLHTGRIFWVAKTTIANYGSFVKDHPPYKSGDGLTTVASVFNTVDDAISACIAGSDDVVYVLPGHTETVTATNIAHDISYTTVIGLGIGGVRPTFTFGAAAATITVSAEACAWENCRFVANFANVASAFTLSTAKSCFIVNNMFEDTSSSLNFLCCVTTGATDNAADRLRFNSNTVYGLAVTDGACVSILGNALFAQVNDNIVDKAATNDAGHLVTLSSKIVGGFQCLRNTVTVVGSSGAAVGILLTGSGSTSSGVVGFNNVWSLDTTGGLLMTASTGLRPMGNYLSGAVDKSGTLTPTADDPA